MRNTPPMPGLEFPNIMEQIVTYESARKIMDWGHRGWEVADALRTEIETYKAERILLQQEIRSMRQNPSEASSKQTTTPEG